MLKYTNACTYSSIKAEPLTMDKVRETIKLIKELEKKEKEEQRRKQFLKKVLALGIQTPKYIYPVDI